MEYVFARGWEQFIGMMLEFWDQKSEGVEFSYSGTQETLTMSSSDMRGGGRL